MIFMYCGVNFSELIQDGMMGSLPDGIILRHKKKWNFRWNANLTNSDTKDNKNEKKRKSRTIIENCNQKSSQETI
jgi:hypothetical protein